MGLRLALEHVAAGYKAKPDPILPVCCTINTCGAIRYCYCTLRGLAMRWLDDAVGLLEREVRKHLILRPEYSGIEYFRGQTAIS